MSVEGLVTYRVADRGSHQSRVVLEGDGDAEGRYAVDEVRRTVQRVHDPTVPADLGVR